MKSLLDKAREDEADAELHQYESDDDEEVRFCCCTASQLASLANQSASLG